MVAIEPPAPGAAPSRLSELKDMPFWLLFLNLGFFKLVQACCYGGIVIKIGGAYLMALNGTTSWTGFGGWPGLWGGLAFGVGICVVASVGWIAGKVAKAMDDEIDRRWGLKG